MRIPLALVLPESLLDNASAHSSALPRPQQRLFQPGPCAFVSSAPLQGMDRLTNSIGDGRRHYSQSCEALPSHSPGD